MVPAGATDTTAGTARISGNPAEVLVGGMPFGAKFYTEGVLVVGFLRRNARRREKPATRRGRQDCIRVMSSRTSAESRWLTPPS